MPEEKTSEVSLTDFKKKVWIATAIIAFVLICILILKTLFSVLLLVFAGIIMAVYFISFAGMLQKYLHCPNKYSVLIAVIINIILIVIFFWFAGIRLQEQASVLSDKLPATIENAKAKMSQSSIGKKVIDYLSSGTDSKKMNAAIKSFFSSTFGILSDVYIIILIGLFFTASPKTYKNGFISLMPEKVKQKTNDLLNCLYDVLQKWLLSMIIGFFFIAILSGLGLWIIGIPLIFTLALIAGLFNTIPNFGPLLALIPAVLLALMQGTTTALVVAGVYTFIQIIQTSVTQPIIQKKMVSLPPVLTIVGQVALGLLGGFWGVLLAVPFVAVVKTVVTKLYFKK